jgi:response regulator RpfG family c-di-GMP phosphodiesterase
MYDTATSTHSIFCILVVDDELFSLSALQRLMRSHHYHTISASDPSQALTIFAANQNIHLVISDYEMPGMNGVSFLREIAVARPETRRIILSAHADSAILLEALNDGGVHRYLTKPWSAKELLQVVQEQHALYLKHVEERSYLQQLSHQQQLLTITNQQLDAMIAERTAKLVEREQELQHANLRLRQLTGRLEQLREEERCAIARDIHDDLAQALTSI